jgi:mono/diheme cytochrome c family protein
MITGHSSHRHPRFLYTSAAIWLAVVSPGTAADVSHGEQLARRWCASCHAVVPDQRQSTQEAPPFATISRRPGFDANKLAFFLLSPHPKMPDMSLTRFEAGDLAAYIGSLAR